jgi:PD-(D/E)XK nuclease superfamily protein
VSLRYRRELIPTALRMDLIVNGQLVVEIKSVERLHPIHSAQGECQEFCVWDVIDLVAFVLRSSLLV